MTSVLQYKVPKWRCHSDLGDVVCIIILQCGQIVYETDKGTPRRTVSSLTTAYVQYYLAKSRGDYFEVELIS